MQDMRMTPRQILCAAALALLATTPAQAQEVEANMAIPSTTRPMPCRAVWPMVLAPGQGRAGIRPGAEPGAARALRSTCGIGRCHAADGAPGLCAIVAAVEQLRPWPWGRWWSAARRVWWTSAPCARLCSRRPYSRPRRSGCHGAHRCTRQGIPGAREPAVDPARGAADAGLRLCHPGGRGNRRRDGHPQQRLCQARDPELVRGWRCHHRSHGRVHQPVGGRPGAPALGGHGKALAQCGQCRQQAPPGSTWPAAAPSRSGARTGRACARWP